MDSSFPKGPFDLGNQRRDRPRYLAQQLWLRDRVVYSKTLWPDQASAGVKAIGFTRPAFFEENSMCRMNNGLLIAMITTDEEGPPEIAPKPDFWNHQGIKVTQYWKAQHDKKHPLQVKVNGRFTYWMSRNAIPNGVAYENFELVQDYFDGQQFIFGITERSPTQFDLEVPLPKPP